MRGLTRINCHKKIYIQISLFVLASSAIAESGRALKGANENENDMADLIPAFTRYFEEKIDSYKRVIKDVKEDHSALQLNTEMTEEMFNEFYYIGNDDNNKHLFEIVPPKYRSRFKSLGNVEEFNIFNYLKDFTSLKKLHFGEFFNYDGKLVFTKGMLPDSVEVLSFYDFDRSVIDVDALPKNIKKIYCGDDTVIKGDLPPSIKLFGCKKHELKTQ